MSREKRKQRRSFAVIGRIFQLFLALMIVFFMSFFITLVVKTPHPIDFIQARYFSDEKTDTLIDEFANEKKNQPSTETDKNNKISDDKKFNRSDIADIDTDTKDKKSENKDTKFNKKNAESIDTSTLSGKIKRANAIKEAVNEKISNYQHYVPLDDIPQSLRQAIVAVEDSRFYKHGGFDIGSIVRATVVNVESGQIEEGGSTITQQLVKNMFLSQEQSFTRKAEELLLAYNMEKNFSKNQILEMYLNTIYFGSNFYGIYDASLGYFDKEPKDLTLAEATMLAGLPNAPSLYSPYVDFMLAKKRQLIVIDAMVKSNILTEREAENARIESITLARDYR